MPDTPLTRGAAALQEAVRATRYPREGVYEQALADGNIPRRILDVRRITAVEEGAAAPRKAKVRRLASTSTHLNLGGGGNCSSSSSNNTNNINGSHTNTSGSNVNSNRRNIHARNSTTNTNNNENNTPTHPRNNSSTSAVDRGSGGDENREKDALCFADNRTAQRVKAQLEGFLPAGDFYCGRPGQLLGRGARSRRRTNGSSVPPKTRARRVAATSTHAKNGSDDGSDDGSGSSSSNDTNDTFSTPPMGTGCGGITSGNTTITTTNSTASLVDTSTQDRPAAMDTDGDSGGNEITPGSAAGGGLGVAAPSPSREHGGDHEGDSSRQGSPASPRAVAELKDFLPAGGFYVQRRRASRSRSTSSSAAESTADGDRGATAPSPDREHGGNRARNSSRSGGNTAPPRAVAELRDFLPAGGFYVQRGRGTRSRSRNTSTSGVDTSGRDKVGVSLRSSGRSTPRRAVAQLRDFLPAGDFYVEHGRRGLRSRRRSDGSGVPAGVTTGTASSVTSTRGRLVRSMSPTSGSGTAAGAASSRALQRSRSTSNRGMTQKARSSAAMKRKKPRGRGGERGGKIPFLCRICEIPGGSVYECDGPCRGCFHFNCVTNRDCALVAKYQRPKDSWYCGNCVSRRRRNLIDGLEPNYEFLRRIDKVKKKNHDSYIVGYTEVPYAPIPTELLTLGPKSSAVTSPEVTRGGGRGSGGGDPDCSGINGWSDDDEGCSDGDGRRRRRCKFNRDIIIAPVDPETPTQAERATLAALNAFVKDCAGDQGEGNAVDGNQTDLDTGGARSQRDGDPLLEDMMASTLGRLRNEALAKTLSNTSEALLTTVDLPVLMPSTGLPDFYRGPWTYSRNSPSAPQVKATPACAESPGFANVVGDGLGEEGVGPAPSPGCKSAEIVNGPRNAEADGDAGGGGRLAVGSSPHGGVDAVEDGLGGGEGESYEGKKDEMREMTVEA